MKILIPGVIDKTKTEWNKIDYEELKTMTQFQEIWDELGEHDFKDIKPMTVKVMIAFIRGS